MLINFNEIGEISLLFIKQGAEKGTDFTDTKVHPYP